LSSTPPYPESSVVIFLDRTHHSKHTERLLRLLGVPVKVHRSLFHPEMPDHEWIPICAANGWAIVTGDKGIEADGLNRSTVIKSAAKIFMMYDYRSKGLEQTAAIIAARRKIARTVTNNVGPFYCPVEIVGESHVGKPNFYPGGYALEAEAVPEFSIPISEDGSNELQNRNRKLPKIKSERFTFPGA
jgi:PIN domain-containing protein